MGTIQYEHSKAHLKRYWTVLYSLRRQCRRLYRYPILNRRNGWMEGFRGVNRSRSDSRWARLCPSKSPYQLCFLHFPENALGPIAYDSGCVVSCRPVTYSYQAPWSHICVCSRPQIALLYGLGHHPYHRKKWRPRHDCLQRRFTSRTVVETVNLYRYRFLIPQETQFCLGKYWWTGSCSGLLLLNFYTHEITLLMSQFGMAEGPLKQIAAKLRIVDKRGKKACYKERTSRQMLGKVKTGNIWRCQMVNNSWKPSQIELIGLRPWLWETPLQ